MSEVPSYETKITWIASYPKSGNTWVRLFLAHYHGWTDINRLGPFKFTDYSRWAFDRVAYVPGAFDYYSSYALKPAALMQLTNMLRVFSERIWLKTHSANVKAYDIPQIPAELTKEAIYIVRDPRDIAVSYAYHMSKDIDTAINEMNYEHNILVDDTGIQQYLSTWSNHVKSWLKVKDLVLLKYEELQEHGLRTMLEKLNIDIDEEKYQAALDATSFDNLKQKESAGTFTESVSNKPFFRSGKPGQWREQLSDDQIKRIVDAHGDIMQEVGYEI